MTQIEYIKSEISAIRNKIKAVSDYAGYDLKATEQQIELGLTDIDIELLENGMMLTEVDIGIIENGLMLTELDIRVLELEIV